MTYLLTLRFGHKPKYPPLGSRGYLSRMATLALKMASRIERRIDMDEERLAERIYNLIPEWDRDGGTVKDTLEWMKKDPMMVIEWLTDYIIEQA